MASLNYMTVPDMMWVNLEIMKSPQPWNYATLEEAVFLQYRYGASADLVGQAAQFLAEFPGKRAFKSGNEATAFVGFVAFLVINGKDLHLDDAAAADWARGVWENGTVDGARAKIEVLLEEHELHTHHGTPDVRGTLRAVLARYPETVKILRETGYTAALV